MKIMKKSTISKIRQKIAVILIVLMSIDGFAAVVSDNDGTAFITKVEFESLKGDFQSQLNQYNTSLDVKLDQAISTYLSGAKAATTRTIKPAIASYSYIRWMHGPYMYFTNRRFTEYTTTAGKYVDTTKWQIINPENRRQVNLDGYLWWYDKVKATNFSGHLICMMLDSYNVPWAWGTGRNGITTSRGPSIYAAMDQNDAGAWVIATSSTGFEAELGHGDRLLTRPHGYVAISPSDEGFGGVNSSTALQHIYTNADLAIQKNANGPGEVVNYTVNNIYYKNGATTYGTDGWLQSSVKNEWNPTLIQTSGANLWSDGIGGLALKDACGYQGFMGSSYSRVGNSLVEDNRWKTKKQFTGDMRNFIYSMWGADVSGEMNVAPPRKIKDYAYIDLSKSPNSVTVPFKIKNLSVGAFTPWKQGAFQQNGAVQASSGGYVGEIDLSIPLFYRIKWKDMASGAFMYEGVPLCKSDGFPIISNAEKKGNLKLSIKYEEKSDTDPAVVTLNPDNKIKTYFKNKPFTDATGTYYRGYKNLKGEGSLVTLNGTEWTSKEITVNIPLKSGESVYMRIDPLTSDGVYCTMTDFNCEYTME